MQALPSYAAIANPSPKDKVIYVREQDMITVRSCMREGTISILILLLFGLSSAAHGSPPKIDHLKNTELCNGKGRVSPEARIEGCTALIQTVQGNATALPIAYNNRGNAYIAQRDYDRAIRDFDQSIKLNATYTKPINNRGVAYLRKGEYDSAIKAFDDAIKLKPEYGEAFANRAEAYLKTKEYDRASSDFDEAIRLNPSLQAAWSGRCWTRAVRGALHEALEDCHRVLRGEPDSAAAYDSLGLIHLKMGLFGDAVAHYDSALRIDPKLVSALYGRGFAKLKSGKAGSEHDIATARSIDAEVADMFLRYGVR